METVVAERRRYPRVRRVESGWTCMRLRTGDPLAIVDICAGGVLVESHRRLLPGTALSVQLAAADRAMSLEARVVRCAVCALEPSGRVRYRGALAFLDGGPRLSATCDPRAGELCRTHTDTR